MCAPARVPHGKTTKTTRNRKKKRLATSWFNRERHHARQNEHTVALCMTNARKFLPNVDPFCHARDTWVALLCWMQECFWESQVCAVRACTKDGQHRTLRCQLPPPRFSFCWTVDGVKTVTNSVNGALRFQVTTRVRCTGNKMSSIVAGSPRLFHSLHHVMWATCWGIGRECCSAPPGTWPRPAWWGGSRSPCSWTR